MAYMVPSVFYYIQYIQWLSAKHRPAIYGAALTKTQEICYCFQRDMRVHGVDRNLYVSIICR